MDIDTFKNIFDATRKKVETQYDEDGNELIKCNNCGEWYGEEEFSMQSSYDELNEVRDICNDCVMSWKEDR